MAWQELLDECGATGENCGTGGTGGGETRPASTTLSKGEFSGENQTIRMGWDNLGDRYRIRGASDGLDIDPVWEVIKFDNTNDTVTFQENVAVDALVATFIACTPPAHCNSPPIVAAPVVTPYAPVAANTGC